MTHGYSLENELFQDGYNTIMALLSVKEQLKYGEIIESICKWFSFEIDMVKRNESYECAFSDVTILNRDIMPDNSNELVSARKRPLNRAITH